MPHSGRRKVKPIMATSKKGLKLVDKPADANTQMALDEPGKFDYKGFPEDVQVALRKRVARLTELGGTFTRTAVEMGEQLAEAQKEVTKYRDGGFQQWVRTELGITEQYAYQYINLYGAVKEGKINLTLGLSNTVLLAIAQPSVSDEARDAVVAKAQAGEKVTVVEAKEVIKADKQARTEKRIEEAAKKAGVSVEEFRAGKVGQAIAGIQQANATLATAGPMKQAEAGAKPDVGLHARWLKDTERFIKECSFFYSMIPGSNTISQFTEVDWKQAHKVLDAVGLIVVALTGEEAKHRMPTGSKK
jgi:hypothetical protein